MHSSATSRQGEVYAQTASLDAIQLWQHVQGDRPDLLGLWSAVFTGRGDDRKLGNPAEAYFSHDQLAEAAAWAAREDRNGREVFFSVAPLLIGDRHKENAGATIVAHADMDGAPLENCPIRPTAAVVSSPGRYHVYWRFSRPVQPQRAEEFNRRLVLAIGADKAAVDATRLLRVPGTHNRKRTDWADVKVLWIDEDRTVDPHELDQVLPKLPGPQSDIAYRSVALTEVEGDDQNLLEQLLQRSPLFARIWQGDTSDYEKASASDVDWGMARDLVKACGGDVDRAHNIMARCESQRREKWDERRGSSTYLRYTLEKAARSLAQSDIPYRSAAPSTWPQHVPDIPGPANGKCSAHCERHHTEIQSLKRQALLVNELIQCDLSPVFKLTLLRLVAIVGFYSSRGTTRFETSAKKIGDSVGLSAQSVRMVLRAIARNVRDELANEHGIIDLDSRLAPEKGPFVSVFQITPLTEGGYAGFLEKVVEIAPELPKPAKRVSHIPEEEVQPPPPVVQIPTCADGHVMHSVEELVTCASCGDDELIRVTETRYVRRTAWTAATSPPPWDHIDNEPQRSGERLADLPNYWPVYDRVAAS